MDEMRISAGAEKAWDVAVKEAAAARRRLVEKEHLLIGLLSLEKSLGLSEFGDDQRIEMRAEHNILENILYGGLEGQEVAVSRLRKRIRAEGGVGTEVPETVLHRSDACKKIFRRAMELSTVKKVISSVHLMAALVEDPGPVLASALAKEGIVVKDLVEPALAWVELVEGGYKNKLEHGDNLREDLLPGFTGGQSNISQKDDTPAAALPPPQKSILQEYGRDLTKEALEGGLHPFAGRRKELLQIMRIFGRHSKNNPVLVGEAGVGKTAIVEALALRTAGGKVPQMLGGYRIFELSVAVLLANTRYRGEFEERLMKIISEAQSRPDVILFIDEIHTIVGAGKGDGSGMDAASLLKPALARGLRCIGTTTIAEYQRYIEADPALERRFEKVMVNEPGRDEAMLMLLALRPGLEQHHGVRISVSALDAAIDLSIRFDPEHLLPDKAIDLLDHACASARIPSLSRYEIDPAGPEVDEMAIAGSLSEKTGIPIEIIAAYKNSAGSRLLDLEAALKGRLLGQDDAISRVCQRLQISYASLGKRNGPMAVFLFTGPSGVGKTEMARLLAEFLFTGAADMIRFDMSEFMEEYSIARLIGSPPGYVGYGEEGQLTGRIRAKPYTVVLFDEIEKAHPKVLDLFLQLFDEGRITDSRGRTADARNILFIMTSNLRLPGLDYDKVEAGGLKRALQNQANLPTSDPGLFLRPELLNRVDEIIAFRSLDEADIHAILKKQLAEVMGDIKRQQGVELSCTQGAEDYIAMIGYSPEFGVRELRRAVELTLKVPLSKLILTGELAKNTKWQAFFDGEAIRIVPIDEKLPVSP